MGGTIVTVRSTSRVRHVDFSAMGLQRQERGPTMLVFVLWIMGIRAQLPLLIVFENVRRFPLRLLISLLGDVYAVDSVILEATALGSP